jgi:hypothetical protein
MTGAARSRRAHAEANRLGYERCKDLPLGAPVTLTLDDGSEMETVTDSSPWQLGGGTWLIKVKGKSGGWDCGRVRRRAAA